MIFQIEECRKNGFDVLGIIGIDRSPSCGVKTTSKNNKEVEGSGLFIEKLKAKLDKKGITLRMIGIKSSKMKGAISEVKKLIRN